MDIIVCVDNEWGISKDGKLLEWIPEDLKNFQKITTDGVVVMGRTTFQSLPNGPLLNRVNMVLTRDKNFKYENVIICHSVDECIEKSEKLNKKVFIIGGGEIYKQFLPHCDRAYVTKIFNTYGADVFIPNLDKYSNWYINEFSEIKRYKDDINYQFLTYVRVK